MLVNGDKKVESNEAFNVHLSGASNATIGDADGVGTITNDDHAPVADTVSVSTERNVSKIITLSASDADGDALTFSIVPTSGPDHGTLGSISTPVCASGSCTATVTYSPNCNYTGSDTFAYKVSDGANESAVAIVSITVTLHVAPVVTNTSDNNAGSLRQALLNAQDGDTVTFNIPISDPGYVAGVWTITLTTGELVVDKDVTINGLGANVLVVRRDPSAPGFRVFHVTSSLARPGDAPCGTPAGVTIQGMTISNGIAGFPGGGGIYNDHSSLTVNSCALSGNSASGADGGGIFNDGRSGSATLTITNSTLSGNAASAGGGISNSEQMGIATLAITNSTLSGNSASGAGTSGGGIFNDTPNPPSGVTITNCTLTGNSAPNGGAIAKIAGSVALGNSILRTGSSGENIYSPLSGFSSLGYNLSNDNSGGFLTGTGDQINTDPILGPLKNNGGPTMTHAPLSNSPAIDRGKDIDATGQDQRGSLRTVTYNDPSIIPPSGGDRSDIGAVELPPGVLPQSAESVKSHGGTPFSIPLALTGPVGIECRSGGATNDYQVIVTFSGPVAFSSAAVTSGTGTVPTTMNSGNQVTLDLTGVTNAQTITLALFDVADGTNSGDVGIRMGMLIGDVSGSGTVNSTDVSQTKLRSGQAASQSNFRSDVNANGVINATDVSTVKIRSGSSLP